MSCVLHITGSLMAVGELWLGLDIKMICRNQRNTVGRGGGGVGKGQARHQWVTANRLLLPGRPLIRVEALRP